MSQYGGQQQYGGQDASQQDPSQSQYSAQQGQGGYSQQDPIQQDPSQSQYGAPQDQGSYSHQDPSQLDPSQPQYTAQQGQGGYSQQDPSQQDPSQSQYGAPLDRSNRDQTGAGGHADRSQQQLPSRHQNQQQGYGQDPRTNKTDDKGHAIMKADGSHGPSSPYKAHHEAKPGPSKRYDASHHNAMYHMSKVAYGGFTKDHMESFIHLGTYALGALANQHGLAPDAPRDLAEDENQ